MLVGSPPVEEDEQPLRLPCGGALTMNIQWYVATFGSGVNVQRGVATMTALTVNAPIAAVASMDTVGALSVSFAAALISMAPDEALKVMTFRFPSSIVMPL